MWEVESMEIDAANHVRVTPPRSSEQPQPTTLVFCLLRIPKIASSFQPCDLCKAAAILRQKLSLCCSFPGLDAQCPCQTHFIGTPQAIPMPGDPYFLPGTMEECRTSRRWAGSMNLDSGIRASACPWVLGHWGFQAPQQPHA